MSLSNRLSRATVALAAGAVNGAHQRATIVANEVENACPGAAQHEMMRC